MIRRGFLKTTGLTAGGFVLGFPAFSSYTESKQSDLALVRNGEGDEMVTKAISLLGGMNRFVAPGQTVLIKPNMSWDRAPEYGANTSPEVAAAVVRHVLQAGAKKVIVVDRTCNEARRCYRNSGLEKAMSDAGASVRHIREKNFETVNIENGYSLKKWDFYRDALESDVIINLPVLKHHSLSKVSMGLKNIMGLIGKNRGKIHLNFDKKIVDLNRVLRPSLTILDATRTLVRNGPSGGSLDDIRKTDVVLAGVDPVLVDAWGAKLFGLEPATLKWLQLAESGGLGSMDTDTFKPLEYSFI